MKDLMPNNHLPKNIQLFTISFVMLFLEILLIRWISTEVRIFAYMSNLVLLACFLGIGLGCYFSKKPTNLLITIGAIAVISLAVNSRPFEEITNMISGFSDTFIWYEAIKTSSIIPALNGMMLTVMMFIMIVAVFVPLGQILGKLLDEHGNIIVGYSINVAASLIGIWAFNICSFLYAPPWLWFEIALSILLLFILFFVRRGRFDLFFAIFISVFILLVAGAFDFSPSGIWSPYQKLTVHINNQSGIANGYSINVNNVGFMTVLDLSDEFIKSHPELYNPEMQKYNHYVLPYSFVSSKDSVLIVGAGAGNDVAGAIRSEAKEINAVEIDPGIYRLGLNLHPEHPYEKKNVNVTIDDARSFLKKTTKKFDLISFGLLDSHTQSSNYNNVRLDHYVYTEESFRDAKKALKEDGIVSVIFQVQKKWIGERLHGLLEKVFGHAPYAVRIDDSGYAQGYDGIMFITSNNMNKLNQTIEADPALKNFITRNTVRFDDNHTKLTTDDWPYLYLQRPGIPRMYMLVIVAISVLIFIVNKVLNSEDNSRIDRHFFFLGSAFLLLEFQNVSKAALLFGSTWIVNSYIISSILLLILLANLFVYYFKTVNIKLLYILLMVSLSVLYIVPLEMFNSYGYWIKSIFAVTLLNLPIFFASIIFINSFKNAPSKDIAFGSNLMGAAIGGLLETTSFIFGIKALLLAVLFLYALSFVFVKERSCSPG